MPRTDKHYKTFNRTLRDKIEALYNTGVPVKEIAEELGYSGAAIYRELKRGYITNQDGEKKYSADSAQKEADLKKANKGAPLKMQNDQEFADFVSEMLLMHKCSPSKILNFIKDNNLNFSTKISRNTLYNYIYNGIFSEISVYDLPMCKQSKHYRDGVSRVIYLDNSATTRICDEALKKYNEVSLGCFGNPSSLHLLGKEGEEEIRRAKRTILDTLYTKDCEVIFTASGTEANNLAILGRAYAKERFKKGGKIITTRGEHASVNVPLEALKKNGYRVAYISTRGGKIDLEELKRELDDSVILVSVMMVNNETGAVYDIPSVSSLVKAKCRDALLHVDATQGYMKIPFSIDAIGADMLTLSSHKIEGPKGVGALVVNKKHIKNGGITAVTLGGGQEMGLRSGTENLPGIAAFGEAARVYSLNLKERVEKMRSLREYLIKRLGEDGLTEISPTLPEFSAPHILNITLPGIKSETMLHYLSSEGIFVSSGSACSSHGTHLDSALTAYGRSEKEADYSIRISLGPRNEAEDIDALIEALKEGLKRLVRSAR